MSPDWINMVVQAVVVGGVSTGLFVRLGRIERKLDGKVGDELCKERRGACAGEVTREDQRHEQGIRDIVGKLERHRHSNGGGEVIIP